LTYFKNSKENHKYHPVEKVIKNHQHLNLKKFNKLVLIINQENKKNNKNNKNKKNKKNIKNQYK
jgi:hypothetical protein